MVKIVKFNMVEGDVNIYFLVMDKLIRVKSSEFYYMD